MYLGESGLFLLVGQEFTKTKSKPQDPGRQRKCTMYLLGNFLSGLGCEDDAKSRYKCVQLNWMFYYGDLVMIR